MATITVVVTLEDGSERRFDIPAVGPRLTARRAAILDAIKRLPGVEILGVRVEAEAR